MVWPSIERYAEPGGRLRLAAAAGSTVRAIGPTREPGVDWQKREREGNQDIGAQIAMYRRQRA
jgi:hypothetical protein